MARQTVRCGADAAVIDAHVLQLGRWTESRRSRRERRLPRYHRGLVPRRARGPGPAVSGQRGKEPHGSTPPARRVRSERDLRDLRPEHADRPASRWADLLLRHSQQQRVRQLSHAARAGDVEPGDGCLSEHAGQPAREPQSKSASGRELRTRNQSALQHRSGRAEPGRHAVPVRRQARFRPTISRSSPTLPTFSRAGTGPIATPAIFPVAATTDRISSCRWRRFRHITTTAPI